MVQKHKTHDVARSAVVQRQPKQTVPAQRQPEPVAHPANVLQRPPAALRPADVLTLQRTVGNRAVQRILIQRTEEPLKGHSLSRGLPDNLKSGIENLSGMDMSDVKVHYNSATPAVLNALAYTQGPQIHMGPSEDDLLRYELSHVGQRRLGRVRPTVQRKLAVGPANDHYEREADRVAASVMSESGAPKIQRQGLEEDDEMVQTKSIASSITPLIQRQETDEEEDPIQTKPLASTTIQRQETPDEEDDNQVQLRSDGGQPSVDSGVEHSIARVRGAGQPLPDGLLSRMEKSFGADFSSVRVHADSESDTLNHSLHARAFTTGHDLFFRRGEYNPDNRRGQELIAHELTHVIQQNGGKSGKKNLSLKRSPGTVIQRNPFKRAWNYLRGYADEERGEFKVDAKGEYGNREGKVGEAYRRPNYNEDRAPDVVNYAMIGASGLTSAGKAIHDRVNVIKTGADFFTDTTPLMSDVGKSLSTAGAVSAGIGIIPAGMDAYKGWKGYQDKGKTQTERTQAFGFGASGVGNVAQQTGTAIFHTANKLGDMGVAGFAQGATGVAGIVTGQIDIARGMHGYIRAKENIKELGKLQHVRENALIPKAAKQAQSTQKLRQDSAAWTVGKGVLTMLGGTLLLAGATTPVGWLLIGVGALVGLKGAYNKWRDKKLRREAIVADLLGISERQTKWRTKLEDLKGPLSLLKLWNRKEIKKLGPSPIEEELRTNGEGFVSVDHYYSNYISKTADELHDLGVNSRHDLETQAIVRISKWRTKRRERAGAIESLKNKSFNEIYTLYKCTDLVSHIYGSVEKLLTSMGLRPQFGKTPPEPTEEKIGKALHE